ncbi:MAG: recombinase family protein [Bacilli bacterium]|nr:recombinase family protein [Bacilli bacterium]MBR1386682.1 recombinase family protein [Bacilli bacterium]
MAGRGNKKLSKNSTVANWLVGVYTRRSFDDNEDKESNTITNQKEMINNFISKENNMTIVDYYIDDGYTGTDFDRPGFQEMMRDITDGRINTIIVKDLSRLGRNSLEVGKYIEDIFPIYNIRIIAINDNVDSFKRPDSINDLIVPIKNLINESYARDISKKVTSAYFTMASSGKFVGGTSPYGYTFDENDKHHLVVEPDEVKNVKLIFDMASKGDGRVTITKYLNDNNILCRKEIQRRKKYKLSLDPEAETIKYKWSTSTIGRMLTSEIYIGNLTQLKTKRESFKNHKVLSVAKEDWIRCENTHEPIITKAQFDKIQSLIKTNTKLKVRSEEKTYSIYNGILKCADCGKAMYKQEDNRGNRQLSNYFCNTYLYISKKSCTSHKIKTEDLNDMVLEAIKLQVKLVIELDRSLKKLYLRNNRDTVESEYKNNTRIAEIKIDNLKNKKIQLYEDWKFNNIDKEEFLKQSKIIEDDIKLIEEKLELITQTYRENIKMIKRNDYWIDHYRRNKKIKKVTKEVLKELIEVIYVTEEGNIDIHFKYKNEYKELLTYLENEGAVKTCQNGELVFT